MGDQGAAVIVTAGDRPRERFDVAARGDASWFTLISGDLTATDRMSAGVMELAPGGVGLAPHRHREPEIYFVVSGSGIVTIDGVDAPVAADATVFIPGDAEHGIRNAGVAVLRVFYVFPTDRFSDVVYRFSADETPAP